MKKRILVFPLFAGTLLASVAIAQTEPATESGDAPTMQQAASDFIAAKRSEQSRKEASLAAAGRSQNLPQLRRLIADAQFEQPSTPGIDSASQAAIRESLITDAAQVLAAANFAPQRTNAYLRAGANPLVAAISIVRGTPSVRDVAILADTIVTGTVQSVEPVGSDLSRSIVTLAVTDTVLGQAATTVRFEQGGSPTNPLQSTLLAGQEAPVLVFLTDAQGNMRSQARSGKLPTTLVSPFALRDGSYRPMGLSTLPAITLNALRAQVVDLTALRVNQ